MLIWKIHSIFRQCLMQFPIRKRILTNLASTSLLVLLLLSTVIPAMAHDGELHPSDLEKLVSWAGLLIVLGFGLSRIFYLRKSKKSDDTSSDDMSS